MATKEQIGAALQAAHAAGNEEHARILAQAYAQAGADNSVTNPTDNMSTGDKFLAGVGMGMSNLARGAGQRVGEILPDQLTEKLGLPTQNDIDASAKIDQALKNTTAGAAGDFVGGTALGALLPGGTLAKSMLGGAAYGALTPTQTGESVAENAGIGAAGGVLGQAALSAGGRLLRPVRSELDPVAKTLADKAQNFGIDLNAAQLTGSNSKNTHPLKWMDSVMNDLPLTAAAQRAAKSTQRDQFNSAVAKTFGSDTSRLTEDAMAAAKNRIGGGIGDIAQRNALTLDNNTFTKLVQHKFDAERFETGDVKHIVNNYIDDFFSKVDNNGQVSGEAYRKLDSELGRRMRGTSNGDLKHALGQVRDTLREGMDNSITPEDASAWNTLRSQYRNMKLVEPLAKTSTDGNISPNALLGAAIKGDSNAAYRSSDLKDLGKIGKEFLGEPPSSGTQQRTYYKELLTNPINLGSGLIGALTGGGLGAGVAALGSGALTSGALAVPLQKLMNSSAGKKYLTQGILKNVQGLEDPLLRYLAAPGGAQGLLSIDLSQ